MPVTYLVARILHIVAGTCWAGGAMLIAWFLGPAARATGPAGGAVMQRLTGPGRLNLYMSAGSLTTTVTGLYLYWPLSNHLDLGWMTSSSGIALTFGGAAGLAAFLIGLLVNARAADRMGSLGRDIQAAGGQPTPVQLAEFERLQHRLHRGGSAGAALLLVAVAGMAAAKYLF